MTTIGSLGSSPLTRGKHVFEKAQRARRRLIPAHAGKTQPRAHQSDRGRAHPRSRGENYFCRPMSHENEGSSPLTRGKRGVLLDLDCTPRLIPAHAGKTNYTSRAMHSARAHPRSRGENWISGAQLRGSEGSSPLTRGKRPWSPPTKTRTGLIPAHAGKTEERRRAGRSEGAHPRSRGENGEVGLEPGGGGGSSPLTRGKRRWTFGLSFFEGLIPAHAGKTTGRQVSRSAPWAHPRSRGENQLYIARNA